MTSERGSYHPALNILIQGLFLLFIAIFIMKFVFTSELFSLIGLGKLGLFTLLAVIYVFLLSEDMAVMVFVIFIPIPIFIQLGVIGENWIRIIPGDLLLVLLLMRTLTQKQLKVPSGPVTLPLLSVILLGFLTLGKASLLLKATIVGLLSYLQSLKFLSYLLVALIFVHTTTQLKKITTTILVSCTFYTIFINWQRMKVVGLGYVMTAHPIRGALFSGGHHLLFGWPGFYALFCAMIFLFAFAIFLRSRKHFPKSVAFIAMISSFLPIIYSGSRTSYLCLIVGLTIMALRGKLHEKFIVFGAVLFLIVCFPHAIEYTFEGPAKQFGLDRSTYSRLMILKESFKVVLSEPLLGYGYNRFRIIVADFFDVKSLFSSAHNLYLRLLVKNGILGLLAYFWLIKVVIEKACKVYKNTRDQYLRSIAFGFICCSIGMLASNFTQSNLFYETTAAFFWFMGGAFAVLSNQLNNRELVQPYPKVQPVNGSKDSGESG